MKSKLVRRTALWIFTAAFTLTMTGAAIAKPGSGDRIIESAGDLQLEYNGLGTSLSLFGIPIIRDSSINVSFPGGSNYHYMQEDLYDFAADTRIEKLPDGGRSFSIRHALTGERHGPYEATQTLTIRPDNTFTERMEMAYHADTPAEIRWDAARIYADAFIGRPIQFEPASASSVTSVPTELWPTESAKNKLGRGFTSVEMDSRFGPVRIEVAPADQDLALEYRRDRWVEFGPRNLYLAMVKGPKLPKDEVMTFEITYKFPKSLKGDGARATQAKSAKVEVKESAAIQTPEWGSDIIIPAPRQVRFTENKFVVTTATVVVVGKNPDESTRRAAAFLAGELERLTGKKLSAVAQSPDDALSVIELSSSDGETSALQHVEGYEISVGPKKTVIRANAAGRGFYNGATTLVQLLHIDQTGAYLKGADVADYPAMDYRGVHLLSGKDAGGQISRAVKDLLSRFKLNNVVWEAQYLKWDSQPDIHHGFFGMDKSDAEQVLVAAQESLVEVQPLVHSLGHSEWIFTNGHNLDIAEDPDRPYAYMPANPRTYEFIGKVYSEALEFFKPVKPTEFHIGHDEFDMRGRVPNRSKSLGNTGDLFIYDILKHHAFFKERGIRLMIWGDLLLAKGESPDACHAPSEAEAKRRRDALPKDITITDWHYAVAPPEKYRSVEIFKEEGFDVIGAGWWVPNNIRNLAAQCDLQDVRGYLQTTWAGFNFDIDGTPENWKQYAAYLLAAEHAWGGKEDNREANNLPEWDPMEVFMDTWFGREPVKEVRAGYTVSLDGLRNRALGKTDKGAGWMELGEQFDLSTFKAGMTKLNGRTFDTQPDAQGNVAVMLAGALNPSGEWPRSVKLEPKGDSFGPTRELHFLMAASVPVLNGEALGEIVVETEAGRHSVPLVYGVNMFAPQDYRMGHETWFAWAGRNGADRPVALWDVVWKAPADAQSAAVKAIEVRSRNGASAPVLFAVTGVR